MSRKPKFRRGRPFPSLAALVRWVEGGGWVMLFRRPTHPAWIMNMRLDTARRLARQHRIVRAEPNE